MTRVSRLAEVRIRPDSKGDGFQIDRQGLWNILEAALLRTAFDADYYLSANADVREGIQSGDLASPYEHFVKFGFLEGRRGWPIKVDERFYLSEYEDVRRSIAEGQFESGQKHFDALGEAEGRKPYSGFTYFKLPDGNGRKALFGKSRRA